MITRKEAINVVSENWLPWTQPVLSANGTIGGASFAVLPSLESVDSHLQLFRAFDNVSTTYWAAGSGKSTGEYAIVYNPKKLKVSSIVVTNAAISVDGYTFPSGTIYGSNDNANWTQLCTFTNTNLVRGSSWTITVNATTGYTYHKLLCTGSTYRNSICIGQITFNAKVLE